MVDFTNIEYLKLGNKYQQDAYEVLTDLRIFDELNRYQPILAGTIPIDIYTTDSDLDIICTCADHDEFVSILSKLFMNQKNFQVSTSNDNGNTYTIAKFQNAAFSIEIFGQNLPTELQLAYKHMIMEYKILNKKGSVFKEKIRQLKETGMKTEPAFAKLLGLSGNPYEELLKFKI